MACLKIFEVALFDKIREKFSSRNKKFVASTKLFFELINFLLNQLMFFGNKFFSVRKYISLCQTHQVEIYNWLGTAPVPPVLLFVRNVTRLGVICRYWRGTKNGTVSVQKICTGVIL